jgi:hypothetical protein
MRPVVVRSKLIGATRQTPGNALRWDAMQTAPAWVRADEAYPQPVFSLAYY